jgi:hypothetical protein
MKLYQYFFLFFELDKINVEAIGKNNNLSIRGPGKL